MGFSLPRCPACGAQLNAETDRDYLFCQFCGAKLINDNNKITIEYIHREINHTEMYKARIEEQKLRFRKAFIITINIVLLLAIIIGSLMGKHASWDDNTPDLLKYGGGMLLVLVDLLVLIGIVDSTGKK